MTGVRTIDTRPPPQHHPHLVPLNVVPQRHPNANPTTHTHTPTHDRHAARHDNGPDAKRARADAANINGPGAMRPGHCLLSVDYLAVVARALFTFAAALRASCCPAAHLARLP